VGEDLNKDALVRGPEVSRIQNLPRIGNRVGKAQGLAVDGGREAFPIKGVGFSLNGHGDFLRAHAVTQQASFLSQTRLFLSSIKHKQIACIKHNACDIDTSRGRSYEQKVIPDPIYKHIGAVIKARRKTLGLKQEALASSLGISRGSLANVETGRQNVLVHQLYKFATALKLSPFDLLPQPAADHSRTERAELPLPGNLKAQQKEQITRLFEQVDTNQMQDREGSRAKAKR